MSEGSPRYTSQVFDLLRAVHQDLQGLSFPELFDRTPTIKFGISAEEAQEPEAIHLVQRADSDMQWERMSPAGRDEVIDIEILVMTDWPDRTGEQVLDRLEVLCDVIQDKYYDRDQKRFVPVQLPAVQALGGLGGVDVQIYPGTSGGYVGTATIRMSWQGRI